MQEAAVKGNQSIVYFTHYVYWFCTIAPALCMCVHAGVSGSGGSQECLPVLLPRITGNSPYKSYLLPFCHLPKERKLFTKIFNVPYKHREYVACEFQFLQYNSISWMMSHLFYAFVVWIETPVLHLLALTFSSSWEERSGIAARCLWRGVSRTRQKNNWFRSISCHY